VNFGKPKEPLFGCEFWSSVRKPWWLLIFANVCLKVKGRPSQSSKVQVRGVNWWQTCKY
jgi:hypothetical protein